MAEATWLGEDGGPYSIEQYGVSFERGKPADLGALSDERVEKLKGNPFFKLSDEKSDAKPVELNPDEEKAQLRSHLAAYGLNPGPNTSLAKLRELAVQYPGPTPAPLTSSGVSDAPVQPIGAAGPVA